jgi:CBS domain-containing protein
MSVILHRRINCLPVVADDLTLEGIVTTTDLLRALYALQAWLERPPAAAR